MTAVAIVTLPGFNEIDSFLALSLLNRAEGVTAFLAGPAREVVSMNDVPTVVSAGFAEIAEASAVVMGSGQRSIEFAADTPFLTRFALDPSRQIISSQCSGALILAKLGLLEGHRVSTDDKTRGRIADMGFETLEAPLSVSGNIATAGGCLSAQYLATWLLLRLTNETETRHALSYVVPVGHAEAYTDGLIDRAKAADPEGLRRRAALGLG
ncbi:DJ-1/PfpI family protein [Pelagibius sp.]|uniref:DJ-1/PfpI family protein n=1 Tax=Pelagibius sp. TaxID=1931238 RepID=UPI003BAE60CD